MCFKTSNIKTNMSADKITQGRARERERNAEERGKGLEC